MSNINGFKKQNLLSLKGLLRSRAKKGKTIDQIIRLEKEAVKRVFATKYKKN